jgi:hypothetical protein
MVDAPQRSCRPSSARRNRAAESRRVARGGIMTGPRRGHATDLPGRWKEPGAFPATDHASRRAHQERGRRRLRRRVRRQCRESGRALGSVIPHAGPIGPLVITMIEAPFGAATVALTGGADRRAAGSGATRRRAIRVAAIARPADRKQLIAASTDFLAQRRVHDVEAAAHFDWTRLANRGTSERTGSVRRSIEAVTEGLGISPPGPHLDPPPDRQTINSNPMISRGRSVAAAPRALV